MQETKEKTGAGGAMRSEDKWDLVIIDKPNGKWVKIVLKWWQDKYKGEEPSIVPSLEDIYRLVKIISELEDKKYPFGEGREFFSQFLDDCCKEDTTWEGLVKKYKIPVR